MEMKLVMLLDGPVSNPGKSKRSALLQSAQAGSGPSQPPIQLVPGFFPGVRATGA